MLNVTVVVTLTYLLTCGVGFSLSALAECLVFKHYPLSLQIARTPKKKLLIYCYTFSKTIAVYENFSVHYGYFGYYRYFVKIFYYL